MDEVLNDTEIYPPPGSLKLWRPKVVCKTMSVYNYICFFKNLAICSYTTYLKFKVA